MKSGHVQNKVFLKPNFLLHKKMFVHMVVLLLNMLSLVSDVVMANRVL